MYPDAKTHVMINSAAWLGRSQKELPTARAGRAGCAPARFETSSLLLLRLLKLHVKHADLIPIAAPIHHFCATLYDDLPRSTSIRNVMQWAASD